MFINMMNLSSKNSKKRINIILYICLFCVSLFIKCSIPVLIYTQEGYRNELRLINKPTKKNKYIETFPVGRSTSS